MKKQLLLLLIMNVALSYSENNTEWALICSQSNEKVLISDVSFLLASDTEDTFSIVCTNGNILSGISSITFDEVDPDEIESIKFKESEQNFIYANNELQLYNLKENTLICIYSLDGHLIKSIKSRGNSEIVSLFDIPKGVYILKVNNTSIKFINK